MVTYNIKKLKAPCCKKWQKCPCQVNRDFFATSYDKVALDNVISQEKSLFILPKFRNNPIGEMTFAKNGHLDVSIEYRFVIIRPIMVTFLSAFFNTSG